MAEALLVGIDACVMIEAARYGDTHPSGFLLKVAASHVFRVLLVDQAEREARKALAPDPATGRLDLVPSLERLLASCLVVRCPDPRQEEVETAYPVLCPRMRHGNDIPLAVAILNTQPDYFVSSNTKHWKPSLGTALGGIRIRSPRAFLEELGAPAPPKPPSVPRGS